MKSIIQKIWRSKLWLLITLLFLIGLNWLTSIYHTRFDLTNEKRFTLTSPTKKLIKSLDSVVNIDVFLKGEFPSGFKRLANSSNEILQEFKEIGGNKIQYNFINPSDAFEGSNITWGDTLSGMGLLPLNLKSQVKAGEQQQNIYPVALVHYKGNTLPVAIYQGKSKAITYAEINSAEAMMEYNFANAIDKLTTNDKPTVAYALGNGEPTGYNTEDLVKNVLQPQYNFFSFNINKQPVIPAQFNVLIIVKPIEKFSEEEKFKLDQYVMNGGKIIFFLDKLNAEMDSLQIKNEVIAYDRGLDVNDLLFKYGVRINNDLIMDLQCDFLPFNVNGNGQFELLPWNYFPVFESKNNHPINKNLGFVSGRFVNSIDTVEVEGIKKTILLSSSNNSRTIATPALISGKENVNAPENEKYNKANIPTAVLLEGKFQSLYSNRISQAMKDTMDKYKAPLLTQCMNNNKMIIVADGDMVLNSVVKGNQTIPMGINPFTYGTQHEFTFANKDFLQNCLDYLINTNGLYQAKAKDYTLQLLDKKKVEEQRLIWQIIIILVPISLVLLFAFIFQWNRKRKYTL